MRTARFCLLFSRVLLLFADGCKMHMRKRSPLSLYNKAYRLSCKALSKSAYLSSNSETAMI